MPVHKLLDRQDDAVPAKVVTVASRAWRRAKRILIILSAAIVLIASAWWLMGRPMSERPGRRSAEAATVVRFGTVSRGDVPVTLEGVGTVTVLSTVVIKTQISGKLTEVGFKEGQSVKKGDFLAQIDPRRAYQAALDQAKG